MSLETPRLFKTAFADDAEPVTINTVPDVPNPNDIAQKPSLAAYTTGFPARSMVPPQAGGQPFYGQDVNGILKDITANTQYVQAGNYYPFDADFQKAVGGYNKFAVVLNPADGKLYQSLVDANTAPLSDTKSWFFFTEGKYLPLQGGGTVNGEVTATGLKSLSYISSENDITSDLRLLRRTGDRSGYFIRRFADDLYIYKAENGVPTDKILEYIKSTDTWNFNSLNVTKNGVPVVSDNDFTNTFTPNPTYPHAGNGTIYLPNGYMIQHIFTNAQAAHLFWPVPFTEFVTVTTSGQLISEADAWNWSITIDLDKVNRAQPGAWQQASFIGIGK